MLEVFPERNFCRDFSKISNFGLPFSVLISRYWSMGSSLLEFCLQLKKIRIFVLSSKFGSLLASNCTTIEIVEKKLVPRFFLKYTFERNLFYQPNIFTPFPHLSNPSTIAQYATPISAAFSISKHLLIQQQLAFDKLFSNRLAHSSFQFRRLRESGSGRERREELREGLLVVE